MVMLKKHFKTDGYVIFSFSAPQYIQKKATRFTKNTKSMLNLLTSRHEDHSVAKTIDIPDELYERLGTYARPFETPAQVIERLLDLAGGPTDDSASTRLRKAESSATASVSTPYTGKLEINFFPSDPMAFKAQLLEQKEAWVRLNYSNGKHETKNWIARSFKPSSDVLGNLRSGYLRGWREKGIIRADVAIEKDDLPDEGENA